MRRRTRVRHVWVGAALALAVLVGPSVAAPPGFLTDPEDAVRQAQDEGKLIFIWFARPSARSEEAAIGNCLGLPQFRVLRPAYVLLYLDTAVYTNLGPDLAHRVSWGQAITTEDGQLTLPADAIDLPDMTYHFLKYTTGPQIEMWDGNVLGITHELFCFAVRHMASKGPVPRVAENAACVADELDGMGRSADADRLIRSAIESNTVAAERIGGFHILLGLRQRLAGKTADGLAELQKAAGTLTLAECTADTEGRAAPFEVRSGERVLGVMSSDLDVTTTWEALKFAAAHPDGPPPTKDVPAADQRGLLAFAVATASWPLADEAVAAIGTGARLGPEELPHAAYLVLTNMAHRADAAGLDAVKAESENVVFGYPWKPYAADALARVAEAGERLGDKDTVVGARRLAARVWGPCIPARLAKPLARSPVDSFLPGW